MAEDNKFTLRIVSPDRVFYEDDAVNMLEFNTTEGESVLEYIKGLLLGNNVKEILKEKEGI